MSFQRLPRKRGEKVNFFFENLSLLPETRQVMEHFKLVFGSGTSDLAKIRPLKNWTPAINWKSSLYENFHLLFVCFSFFSFFFPFVYWEMVFFGLLLLCSDLGS